MARRSDWISNGTSALLAALLTVSCVAPAPRPAPKPAAPKPLTPGGTASAFRETFDGAPASPAPFASPNWDVAVHSRDHFGATMDAVHAHHGAMCTPPPETHPISRFDQAVFRCKDHVMTSMNGAGYGEIVLTPNRAVDFSKGTAVVSFDVSTLVTSRRDWWDLWITPYAENVQLPCEDWCPDLQGPPKRAVHINMSTFNGNQTGFGAEIYSNFKPTAVPGSHFDGYERFLTPDAARRDTFELRISRTHIRFGMPAYGVYWINAPIKDLGWDVGVVQFAHHSYSPTKDTVVASAQPNTWHWDNVAINPSRAFKIIRAQQRAVDREAATFPSAAPQNARLRFSAYGTAIQVSFDAGRTWANAARQLQSINSTDHFASYWTPIPAGATRVNFRGQPGCCPSAPAFRDISIWAV
jgi:hypothetical protein